MSDDNDFFDDVVDDEAVNDEDDSEMGDEYDEDDEDDEDDDEFAAVRTAVMAKNEMIALISLKTSPRGGIIVRVDPRQALPAAQTYEDADAATRWFRRSLATSKRNGWLVVYDGTPSFG